MKQFLEEVQQTLLTITDLRYISPDWGQLDLVNPPVLFPCAIVGFDGADYADFLDNSQEASAKLVVSVAHVPTQQISINAPKLAKDEYYKILDIIDKISKKLVNTSFVYDIKLTRKNLQNQRRDDGVLHYEITFEFSYTEDLSIPYTEIDKPKLIIK